MTSKERFLAAISNRIPDRVPATPDISNYVPAKRTGLPFWDIYFYEKIPLRQAFLDASDYFGLDCWTAGHLERHLRYDPARHESRDTDTLDKDRDAMVRRTTYRTPDGHLTTTSVCYRYDPPSAIEKPIKDLTRDWKKFKWLLRTPVGIDAAACERDRRECYRRGHAYGLGLGYPGFQIWMVYFQGGVEPLVYAEADGSPILQEWFELDMARGDKEMEYILSVKPDYVFFGGSGTITLASPALAMKYAIPALAKWSKMAHDAGIPSLIHSCGKQRAMVDMLCDHTHVTCVNPLEPPPMGDIDLAEVKRARGRQIAFMGNLHTTDVMLRGTPADVTRASVRAMRDAGAGGGFILSTGDQCGRETPDENIFAMVEAVKKYGVYDPRTGALPNLPPAGEE